MPRVYFADAASHPVTMMAGEKSLALDPVLSHLLRPVRPASVRHKLADVDPQHYTAAHEVVLLVSWTSDQLQKGNRI